MINTNFFAPKWQDVSFAQAISLGNFCHSAQVLKDLGYRTFSGPFDWIFNNPRALTHILTDHFATFLDRQEYIPVLPDDRVVREANFCHHRFYKEKFGVHYMFNHHSPNEDSDYEHYLKAVQDFKEAFVVNKPILFLLVTNSPLDIQIIKPILSALDTFNGPYKLLAIRFVPIGQELNCSIEERVETLFHDDELLMANFKVCSPSNGVIFSSNQDNKSFSTFIRSFHVGQTEPD
jgi:hypothetical protein